MTADEDIQPIIRLAARGDGVTADGRFVALAAPGDRVRFEPDGSALIDARGPDHAVPPCRHFPECGGCQMQHVSDAAYARWMAERIGYALAQAGVEAGETMPPHLSPPCSRRRATLRAVRTAAGVVIGFQAEGTHRVIDLQECWVLRPELFALVAPLRELLPGLIRAGQGGGVSLTLAKNGVDLMISNVDAGTPGVRAALADFAEVHDLARLSVEGSGGIETVAEPRAPVVVMGGADVRLPPAAFLQATAEGEAALVAAVLAAADGARNVADLFSGLGTFALPLAAAGARVTAADASGPAYAALSAASAGRPVAAQHRDLFRRPFTAAELSAFDAIVFDPPRAGAKAQAEAIAMSAVPRVIAVSCNPPTFARDAAILCAAGYALERLWPVGQFRWSNHVELVASFTRASARTALATGARRG